jgi:hypothetical protein
MKLEVVEIGGLKCRQFRLSSGRVIDPGALIVGIDPNLQVWGGYDDNLFVWPDPDEDEYRPCSPWTPAERAELADYMIERWQEFKKAAAPKDEDETAASGGRDEYGPGCDETGRVNRALPPRGDSYGKPPVGLRNWDCRIDGHEDPDHSGLCIHCEKVI